MTGFKPVYQVLELRGFHRLVRQLFWRWLLEHASSRTSFLLEDQVRTETMTVTSAWPVELTRICRRARPLVNRRSGTGYQCRKSTGNCSQATQSHVTEHDCSPHHRTTVATGCTSCRLQLAAYISTTKL